MKAAVAVMLFLGLASLIAMLILEIFFMSRLGFTITDIKLALIAPPIFGVLLAHFVTPHRWRMYFTLAWISFGAAMVPITLKLVKLSSMWPQSLSVVAFTLAIMFITQSLVMFWRSTSLTPPSSGTR
jgi:hypothetical protein